MKKYIFTALLCGLTWCAQAQRISRHYQDESLSRVLEDLNTATSDKTIYFIYDELEDFTVTSHFSNLSIKEAIREVIGFYPMKVTYDNDNIFIECTQKENTKVIGRIIDESGQPIEFANISLYYVTDHNNTDKSSTYINGGVSNENGDFVIPCKGQRITLKVSYIGYKNVTRDINVGNIGTLTLENIRVGYPDTLVIIGAGPIGDFMAQISKIRGAQRVIMIDINRKRLEMARQFGVDEIINTGVAGAVAHGIVQNDMVVASRFVQHDVDTSPIGDPVGFVSTVNTIYFEADRGITERLRAAIGDKAHTLVGTIATGDQFVADKRVTEKLRTLFDAAACDMEGGAIAQVCTLAGVPFGAVRCISDSADEQATMDYPDFAAKAAATCSAMVIAYFA